MPLSLRNGGHFDAVITARVGLSAARHGQKGHAVTAGTAGRQGRENRHVEEVISALEHDGAGDGEEVRPEIRYV